MDNMLVAAFISGLTAGGLSCFAVQGGLLTGSFARQMESQGARVNATNRGMALSVTLFLLAKLVAYTLLGFGLGWLGSILFMSAALKGALQILVGIFLLGNALRMFNVHPIFRFFAFEPPSTFTRFIRKISKGDDRFATPLFLGALTVLIPCGVTQSAMAVAMGTGSPLMGGAVMFAFVLGTSPTFFGVTVLAAGMARAFQRVFYPVVATLILILGLVTIDGGLNIVGSPISSATIVQAFSGGTQVAQAETQPGADGGTTVMQVVSGAQPATTPTGGKIAAPAADVVTINVKNDGYSPKQVQAPAGKPFKLLLRTSNTQSCSRAFVIPKLNVQKVLPATGDTYIDIPAQAAGSTLPFTCSMGMYTGVINFQ